MEEMVAITEEEVEEMRQFIADCKYILLDPRVRKVLRGSAAHPGILEGLDCPAKQAILRLTRLTDRG